MAFSHNSFRIAIVGFGVDLETMQLLKEGASQLDLEMINPVMVVNIHLFRLIH
jgi:hypothetical protein